MPSHADILDERESQGGALLRSLGLHLGVAAVIAGWSYIGLGGGNVERWGDPKSLAGGAYAVTPVSGIRLPQPEGRVNPVANDTESQVPSAPAPPKAQPKKAAPPPPDPNAIALKSRMPKKAAPQTPTQRYTSEPNPKTNQVFTDGQRLNSPIFTPAASGGGIGSGTGSPFGTRFGWYEQLLREQVGRNWQSQNLDRNVIRTRVAVTFEILRNGTVRNVRVTESSGNFAMDQSAQRAILASNPLPALPPQFERDSATIEFWFSLQR